MKLIYKIPLLLIIIGLSTLVAAFYLSYSEVKDGLSESGLQQAMANRIKKVDEIEDYFASLDQALISLANSPQTGEAIVEFVRSYTISFQRYDSYFLSAKERIGVDDLLLINPQGDIVYSVNKNIDLGRNLSEDGYRMSGLATVFNRALDLAPGERAIADFAPYPPALASPVMFIATPIKKQGELLGVVAMRLATEPIDKIMTNNNAWRRAGLGDSGEAYLVGDDYLMRSNSRFFAEDPNAFLALQEKLNGDSSKLAAMREHRSAILLQEVRTLATSEAFAGVVDTKILKDYRGVSVISSYQPLQIAGLQWVIVSELDEAETLKMLYNIKDEFIQLAVVLFVALVLIAILAASRITQPLNELVVLAKSISKNDFSKRIPITRADELGALARAFNEMTSTLEVASVSKDYVGQVINSMGEALFVLRSNSGKYEDLRIQTINKATQRILEVNPVEIIYHTLDEFVEGGFRPNEFEQYALNELDILPSMDKVLITKSGRRVPVLFTVSVMRNVKYALKESLTCVCIAKDISDRKQIEEKLKLVSTVFNNSAEPVLICDSHGKIVELNSAYELALGFNRRTLLQQSLGEQKVTQLSQDLSEVIKRTSLLKEWRGEVSLADCNNKPVPFLVACSAVGDKQGGISHYVLLFSNITELKDKEQHILNIANHDILTGLPNRMLLNDRVEQTIRRCVRNREEFAVMFLDLDGFKQVNDGLGHQAGDELLVEVAKRLRLQLRESDTVARLGGDEFVVLLNQIKTEEDYLLVANKILTAINQPYALTQGIAHVSTSIGIATYPTHVQDKKSLLDAADNAMYTAKKNGKNRIVVAQPLDAVTRQTSTSQH